MNRLIEIDSPINVPIYVHFFHAYMPISRHAGTLVLRFDHLTRSNDIRQSKQHSQLTVVFSQASVASLGEPELAFDDPERMLNLGSYAGFHVFNIDHNFVDPRVFLQRPNFFLAEQAEAMVESALDHLAEYITQAK